MPVSGSRRFLQVSSEKGGFGLTCVEVSPEGGGKRAIAGPLEGVLRLRIALSVAK